MMRKRSSRFVSATVLAGFTLGLFLALGLFATASADASPSGAMPEAHVNWTDHGYKDKDVSGGSLEDGEGHMAPPLMWQMINFTIFIGILVVVVGPRIKKVMNKNHDQVKTALAEAATMKAEAAAKLSEYKKRIAKVDSEVDDLVKTIKADADAERERIIAAAQAQAATLKRSAEERIAASIGRARAELESEVIAAAVAAAEGVLTKKIDDRDQNNLVEEFIASVESGRPGTGGGGSGGRGPKSPDRDKRDSQLDEGWS